MLEKSAKTKGGRILKKLLAFALISWLLSACNLFNASPSIEKLEKAPKNVQELLDPAAPLQSVNEDGEMTYIIYQTTDEVTASVEKHGDKLNVKLKSIPKDGDEIKQQVFKLKVDKDTEMIDILINGKSTPIGIITGS